jgi:hypothetical protein
MPVCLVDIDLGDARPIGKITFDSITGSPGIRFPLAVRVFVSSDGQQYDLLSNMMTKGTPQSKPLTNRFVSDDLKGWGRYVRLALLPDGPLMFFDEIEIMERAHTRQQAGHINKRPIPAGKVKIYAKQMRRGTPDLWSYSGYGSDRGEMHESGGYYGEGKLGHNPEVKAEHPEFYRASMDINALLVRKSFLDEKLRSAGRAKFYKGNIDANDSQTSHLSQDVEDIRARSHRVNTELNDLFQFYGRAFDAGRSVEKLSGIDKQINSITDKIQGLEADIGALISHSSSRPLVPLKKQENGNG